jgi:hypothetical protein
MKKAVWSGIIAAVGVLAMSTPVFAQANDTASVTVAVNVSARAKLTLGLAAISFADADPDVSASLTSSAISIDVKARTTATGTVALTVKATDDLKTAGGDAIAIGGLTWSSTGTSFSPTGTSNKTTAQSVGSWTGSGSRVGSQTYALANSWSYATGSYSATLTYTLVAP